MERICVRINQSINQSVNKHCSKLSQETLLNSVSYDLLRFTARQSHDSFTLLSVKDVMLFQHCEQAILVLFMGYIKKALWSKPGFPATSFCMSEKLKSAEILVCCHSQQCRSSWHCPVKKAGKFVCVFLLLKNNMKKLTAAHLIAQVHAVKDAVTFGIVVVPQTHARVALKATAVCVNKQTLHSNFTTKHITFFWHRFTENIFKHRSLKLVTSHNFQPPSRSLHQP
jgi:hypothetical protein